MMKAICFAAFLAVLSTTTTNAFVANNRLSTAATKAATRSSLSSLHMSAALIVQNKGGGHGELGFQLAKNLSNNPKITSITILQDDACDDTKEPFKSYASDIPNVLVIKANLSDESMTAESLNSLLGSSFEYVWDNASKKPEGSGKAICDAAKSYWNTKVFTYVSSAGMYQPTADTTFPMAETTPIKETAGQALFDKYAVDIGLPLVSFRPQYIYGPKANKYDYIDWYFDRIVRDLPLLIPGDGSQKVSLTNSEDVASILASVLNNEEAAIEQRYFNCGTDDLVGYDEVGLLCADAAGVDRSKVKFEHIDADAYGKGKFPFRPSDFYVAPDMVKEKLGWVGSVHKLKDDLSSYYDGYKARGGLDRKVDVMKDYEIVVASKL